MSHRTYRRSRSLPLILRDQRINNTNDFGARSSIDQDIITESMASSSTSNLPMKSHFPSKFFLHELNLLIIKLMGVHEIVCCYMLN